MSETPRVILMMIPSSAYDRGLLEGITSYTQIHGPWVFLLSGDHPDLPIPASDSLSGDISGQEYQTGGKTVAPIPNFERLNATGLIGRIQSQAMAKKLLAAGLPVVGMFALSDVDIARLLLRSKVSEILVDGGKTGQLAAEHFLDRGFWNYAFCGYEGRAWVECRLEGFAERLAAAGFSPDVYRPTRIGQCLAWKQEMPRVMAWLKSLPRPVAVMACNDKRGRQIIEACLFCGLKVPEDVAVVGVDNDHLFGNLSNPPLSSVALNVTKAGYQTAELLDHLMRGTIRKPRQIAIEPLWVVPRRSSDVIAVDDPPLVDRPAFCPRTRQGGDRGGRRGSGGRDFAARLGNPLPERPTKVDPCRDSACAAGTRAAIVDRDESLGREDCPVDRLLQRIAPRQRFSP